MFKWNTDKICSDLSLNDCVTYVAPQHPGGDVDTDNIILRVAETDEYLYVCGFSVEAVITDPSDTDVEMIEITDTHGNGLQSDNHNVALAFITIRQYFVGQHATVVNRLKDYF
jgi:hypothetical protein